jgi:hypothetical protein
MSGCSGASNGFGTRWDSTGARGGTRTRTGYPQRILSPPRLPFRHLAICRVLLALYTPQVALSRHSNGVPKRESSGYSLHTLASPVLRVRLPDWWAYRGSQQEFRGTCGILSTASAPYLLKPRLPVPTSRGRHALCSCPCGRFLPVGGRISPCGGRTGWWNAIGTSLCR